MVTAIIIAIYIVGMVVSYKLMNPWPQKWYIKAAWSLIWPMTAVLYGIYWLHMKL